MKSRRAKLLMLFLGISFFIMPGCLVFSAQIIKAQGFEAQQKDVLGQQAELQKQLQELEAQIKQYQLDLKNIQGQKNTLQNKISQLGKQKSTLELQLKSTDLQLDNLDLQLNSAKMSIEKNQGKSEDIKAEMSEMIRIIYENDNYPWLYAIIQTGSLANIFTEIANNEQIMNDLAILLEQNQQIKIKLAETEEILNQKIDEVKNLKSIQDLQVQNLALNVSEQKILLQKTKGQESNYQQEISDAKKEVQAIKNRIYSLLEVQKQINFGQAVTIAQWASSQTGVRPAFLLAVLSQESSLGKNVGTCNRANDPPSKSYKVVMNPTRDIPPFLEITKSLSLNPKTTPISCPMHDKQGNQIGWGGAMGPAQFIPSTWQGYNAKVTAITGKPSNPWDIRDAFLAAALKLGHDGASSQSGEWSAAMRYFSGSTNPAYSFYGDSVISKADQYQADIDQINNN
jgi:membrane-bound lytic murein transglycosylase B